MIASTLAPSSDSVLALITSIATLVTVILNRKQGKAVKEKVEDLHEKVENGNGIG